jgi:hypothetical protein
VLVEAAFMPSIFLFWCNSATGKSGFVPDQELTVSLAVFDAININSGAVIGVAVYLLFTVWSSLLSLELSSSLALQ